MSLGYFCIEKGSEFTRLERNEEMTNILNFLNTQFNAGIKQPQFKIENNKMFNKPLRQIGQFNIYCSARLNIYKAQLKQSFYYNKYQDILPYAQEIGQILLRLELGQINSTIAKLNLMAFDAPLTTYQNYLDKAIDFENNSDRTLTTFNRPHLMLVKSEAENPRLKEVKYLSEDKKPDSEVYQSLVRVLDFD